MPPRKIARAPELPVSSDKYRDGPLAVYLGGAPLLDIAACDALPDDASQVVVCAANVLQDVADYRGTLQRWFACLQVGGFLVVTVPHAFLYERQDAAPSRRRATQRRLYSPRALIEEVEEALAPNSYRVRWLGDLDDGYDYAAPTISGQAEVGVAIERITQPSWGLAELPAAQSAPVNLFESDHDRIEKSVLMPAHRILVVKLDHLGDFVMGIGALERLRAAFPESEITLVVGSWNEGLVHELGVADYVLTFDAFPRNTSEDLTDVAGKAALFDALVTGRFDLAIDLRTDTDSRALLRNVQAPVKAGIGLRAYYPFLDIALPIDPRLGGSDPAWSEKIDPDRFIAVNGCTCSPFSIACDGHAASNGHAIIWGPYRPLPIGDFVFEPFLEMGTVRPGLLACDGALNNRRVVYAVGDEPAAFRLAFTNTDENVQFEFRLFAVDGEPVPDFRFYGGQLSKRGETSALHQSEYLILLVELIVLRVKQAGLLARAADA